MNGHLTGHIHSPYRLADQLQFSLKVSNYLNRMEDQLLETELEDVLTYLKLISCSKVCMELTSRSYIWGHMSKYTLSYDKQDAIKSATGIDTPDVLSFSQVHHEGTLRSTSYGKMDGKRNSSICLFRNSSGEEVCGVVDRFCMVNSKPFALIRPYKVSGSYLQAIGISGRTLLGKYAELDLLSSFLVRVECQPSTEVIAVSLEDIETVISKSCL